MKNKTKWDELSIREKADLMKLFVDNDITDLNQIHSLYNSYQDGGVTNQENNNIIQITESNNNEDTYYQGALNSAVKTAYLTREQWAKLNREGKVNLQQVPKQYRNWVQAENHQFKQGITNAMNDVGNKILGAGLALSSFIPIVGNAQDAVYIGLDLV